MKYDDASWHYNGTFPVESPNEYGGTHIALFLKWCFINGLAGDLHLEDTPDEVNAVITGTMTATDFFFKNCDGKLTDEDFNEIGVEFADFYYGENGEYLNDYAKTFSDSMYIKSESSHDFIRYSKMLEARWREWKFRSSKKRKNWFEKLMNR